MPPYLKQIAESLLKSRVADELMNPALVYKLVCQFQPSYGLSADEWKKLTDFIIKLEKANDLPNAENLAKEYELSL